MAFHHNHNQLYAQTSMQVKQRHSPFWQLRNISETNLEAVRVSSYSHRTSGYIKMGISPSTVSGVLKQAMLRDVFLNGCLPQPDSVLLHNDTPTQHQHATCLFQLILPEKVHTWN